MSGRSERRGGGCRWFTEHPATVGETYAEHFKTASGFSRQMIMGGLACLVHAVFPFLHVTTGSRTIDRLYSRMILQRARKEAGEHLQRAAAS